MKPTILKSLMKPTAYPVQTSTVELVQTHVSWIFLTETHAFKIKKPVNFGFLDFSSIDRRRFYCNEELRLNRRLCPDIYEAVVELRESTRTGVAFYGSGPIIDYAVMMKRLPADNMLDILVESGKATTADMKNVADVISTFHAKALSSPYISNFGSLEKIQFNWRENFEQLITFTTTLPATEQEIIRSWVMTFIETNRDLFNRRKEQGFIRECDGDLHLENICLVEDRVYIFDCIEFNERFRFCDTTADLAFLLMDLDFHNRSDLSEAVIKAYSAASGDSDLSELIDFYKIYRAVVRGKVESFRLNDSGIPANERESAQRRAIRYFRLARGYIERLTLHPTLFITCGTMGCGKSTLAEQLAFELGIKAYNSDIIRKKIAGFPPVTTVGEEYGQGLYADSVSEETYTELERLAEYELIAGHSVIIDASFRSSAVRVRFAGLAARWKTGFIILMVSCGYEEQKKRLLGRTAGGHSVSDGRIDLLEQQKAGFEYPSEMEGRVIEVSSIQTPELLIGTIYKELRR